MSIWRVAVAAAMLWTGGTAAAQVRRDGVWAQTYVDRPADPAVTFGQLPNGLRYAVMHNATPPRQVSLRLVIAAGSLAEADGQQGLAHFVEHMAFRGSTHVPDGELMRTLERHGLAVGADTNAFTTPEATFYQFDLPENDPATVATGLGFLRETASEVGFAAGAVAAERAVIQAEERTRDGPALHVQLRDFYRVHYRPEAATVIVVGDVDPAAIVAAIAARFGDWTAAGRPPPPVDTGTPAARGLDARVFTEPGVSHAVELAWLRPFDATADTVAHRRDVLLDVLATRIFNQRLQDLALAAKPPFLVAQMARANILHSANITSFEVHAPFAHWPEGLGALIGEQRRLLQDGVTAAELGRTVTELRTSLVAAEAGAATRTTRALAAGLLGATLGDLVFASPAQERAEFDAAVPGIDVAAVEEAFRRSFAGAGPLLFLTAAGAVPDGEAKLRAAYAAAGAAPVPAAVAASIATWPYDHFGPPGKVVARRVVAPLGVTVVDFANGATLLIKPTDFAHEAIEVGVRFGFGRAGLPPARSNAFWTATSMPVFVNGGTGSLSATELQRLLLGHVVGVDLQLADAAFDLRGHTRPADLPLQMQLLTAFLSDPGYRPESFDRLQTAMASSLLQLDNDPNLALLRALPRALHAGDVRWETVPDRLEVANTTLADARALSDAARGQGRIGVTIVGDVDVEQAIAAVGATIGTLPRRSGPVAPSRTGIAFPTPEAVPAIVVHQGRADKAIAVAAWKTNDFYANPRDARALLVAIGVLRSRLTDRMRGADGLTYSPDVDGSFSNDFDGYGNVVAQIELAPDRIEEYYGKLDLIVGDLAAHEPTPDELARAKQPVIEGRTRDLTNNAYWSIALARATRDRREFAAIAERVQAVQAVTAADVRRVALRYLRPEAAFRLAVRPAAPLFRPLRGPRAPIALCSNRFVRACQPG